MRRLNPTMIALLGGLAILLLLVFVLARGGDQNPDKLADDQLNQTAGADPEKRCGAQATYDLIKRELFRRAAQLRGSDQAAFDKLGAYSVVRMDAPMLRAHDKELGTINCTGTLALDLPPGVAVVGGRRTLTADISYSLQPAADGSGTVLTLANVDPIVTPLATLARIGAPTGQPLSPAPADSADDLAPVPDAPASPQAPPPSAAPEPAPTVSATPSFNCRNARTRGEIAVCADSGLAALDRQMAAQFNGAMSRAAPDQRALLQQTRSRFLAYRDNCRSDACIADAYRGRITEIGDIMAGRWRSAR